MSSWYRVTLVLLLCLGALEVTALGQGGTTQYIYDANGRLSAVLSPSGEAAIYRYDPAGNLTEIDHIGAGDLAVLSFSPAVGTVGDQVTLQGVGLDSVSSVLFNNTPAQILSASPSQLTTAVPDGASSGPITVSGVRGAFSTADTFTVVARVEIGPSSAEILPNETVQFVSSVVGTADQRVTWAVNGIAGGSSAVGVISSSGVYIAPNSDTGLTVSVSATSVADPSVSSQVDVRILNPNTTSEVRSPALIIARGISGNNAALAASVSIVRSVFANDFIASRQVIVQKGSAISAVALPVTVEIGPLFSVLSAAVSATTGPVISGISPSAITHGTSATVTVSGKNFGGANQVLFLASSGAPDRNISVTGISVSPDGTTLTFNANLTVSATVGTDVLYVSTPNGPTPEINLGSNTVQIQ